jgi:hypothetical protein
MNDHIHGEDLAAYVDGRLSQDKKSELEKHFAGCPQCLDELADLAVITGGRDRIPARFLKQALGGTNAPAAAPLRLRLVFEVAAALLVVVFIGYFFLSNNRFWQTPDKLTLTERMADKSDRKDRRPPDLDRKTQTPAPLPAEKGANDLPAHVAPAPAKKSRAVESKDLSAAVGQAVPGGHDPGALQETAPAMAVPSAEREKAAKQEQSLAEAKSKASPTRLDAAAPGRPAAQSLGVGAAQVQEEKRSQEQTADAAPAAGAGQKTNAARARDAIVAQAVPLPIRIAGDVNWSNLQNPERIASWSWFPKDLVLELEIDQAGTVIAVVVSQTRDEALAVHAEKEARKLVFAISEKKSRRARLLAKDAAPN